MKPLEMQVRERHSQAANSERDDMYLVSGLQQRNQQRSVGTRIIIMVLIVVVFITFIMAAVALGRASSKSDSSDKDEEQALQSATIERNQVSKKSLIENIAFGSCSAYDVREITIFTQGVMKSDPDMWIWLGDMVYLDKPSFTCTSEGEQLNARIQEDPKYEQCLCEPTWMHVPPSCFAGDTTHAMRKVEEFLHQSNYRQFVDFMCPNYYLQHQEGSFPPIGIDCEKPIIGTYDDHDFGWNDGDSRFPQKAEIKQLFLDAIGEPQNSIRRSKVDGLQTQYILNEDYPGKEIQVVLLDERYHRSPYPCLHVRTVKCKEPIPDPQSAKCEDLKSNCCRWDDDILEGFCSNKDNAQENPLLCDVGRSDYASAGLNGTTESPICEMLGMRQRNWLNEALQQSDAKLHLIGSGSVVFGSGKCGGDNWECYRAAQRNLIQTLNNVTGACVVILTGDYHFSDIKLIDGDKEQQYADIYGTSNLKQPIYQLMSSGMSNSTASGWKEGHQFCWEWKKDEIGLRAFGECGLYEYPSFGMVQVDWENEVVQLSIRDNEGFVAQDPSGQEMMLNVDLTTCTVV